VNSTPTHRDTGAGRRNNFRREKQTPALGFLPELTRANRNAQRVLPCALTAGALRAAGLDPDAPLTWKIEAGACNGSDFAAHLIRLLPGCRSSGFYLLSARRCSRRVTVTLPPQIYQDRHGNACYD
jgi:hypothetical protein